MVQGQDKRTNLALIGMPGAGKSTVGVLAAKALGLDFCDTDIVIQSRAGMRLQAILESRGLDDFLLLEEDVLCHLVGESTVYATGGSVVYGERGMRALQQSALIIHLDVPLAELERRLDNAATRGIAMRPGYTLETLYLERKPLYERYADLTITWTEGMTLEGMTTRLLQCLGETEWACRLRQD